VLVEPRDTEGRELNTGHAGNSAHSARSPTLLAARDDQATVRPPFDPEEFARQSEMSTVPPPAQVPDLDPVVSSETLEVLFVDAETIPSLAVAREDLEWFDLSPQVRELLHHVDGEATLTVVCTRANHVVDEGIALVEQLVRDGVLSCR
jgi:hypothetical protein